MKKLLATIAISVLVVSAFAQTKLGIRSVNWEPVQSQYSAQSIDTNLTPTAASLLWLRDGLSSDYTAIAYPLAQIVGLGNRIELVGLGAFDSEFTQSDIWVGTGVAISVFRSEGWNVKLYGGYKGFNLGKSFEAAENEEAWVWGVGISIPVK